MPERGDTITYYTKLSSAATSHYLTLGFGKNESGGYEAKIANSKVQLKTENTSNSTSYNVSTGIWYKNTIQWGEATITYDIAPVGGSTVATVQLDDTEFDTGKITYEQNDTYPFGESSGTDGYFHHVTVKK